MPTTTSCYTFLTSIAESERRHKVPYIIRTRVGDVLTLISSHVPFSSSNLRSLALRTTRLSSSESESLDPTMNLQRAWQQCISVTWLDLPAD